MLFKIFLDWIFFYWLTQIKNFLKVPQNFQTNPEIWNSQEIFFLIFNSSESVPPQTWRKNKYFFWCFDWNLVNFAFYVVFSVQILMFLRISPLAPRKVIESKIKLMKREAKKKIIRSPEHPQFILCRREARSFLQLMHSEDKFAEDQPEDGHGESCSDPDDRHLLLLSKLGRWIRIRDEFGWWCWWA